jgi:hypothetical protein
VTDRFILYDLFSLPNKTLIIKLRRMRWVGLVARIGNWRDAYKFLLGRPEGNAPLERRKLG